MNKDSTATTIAKSAAAAAAFAPLAYLALPAGAADLGIQYTPALPISWLLLVLALASCIIAQTGRIAWRSTSALMAASVALPILTATIDLALVFAPALSAVEGGSLTLVLLAVFEVASAVLIIWKVSHMPFIRCALLCALPLVAYVLSSFAMAAVALLMIPFVLRIAWRAA